MADRTVIVRLRAEVNDFKRQMGEAAKSTADALTKNSASVSTLSNQAGMLGLAMVAAAGLAVKSFADFDAQMSAVQAATHESAATMSDLSDAALEAGKRTVYSATEAAGAIENLAKAGIAADDILNGGLNGALDLAAAGAIDVAEAADIAATAMTQFGLEGDQVTHVADLLAAGASSAQGGVGDLGMALKQAGLVANATGLSIEETTAGLTSFAAAGLIGSDAGTSFKAMLQRLTPQSAEAKAEMDRLGISAYDAGGNFVGLEAFAGNLQTALKDLTPEQRNSALATIFGSDAVRAATVLYDEGAQGIADWTEAVDQQGYAAETAAIRLDNLKGDLEQLGGAFETALINAGAQGDGPMRALTQQATDVVNALGGMPPAAQAAMLALVGGGGLALLGIAGIGKLAVSINETKLAMDALGWSAKGTAAKVGLVGGALVIAGLALSAWADESARAQAMTEALAATLDDMAGVTGDTEASIRDMLAEGRNMSFLKFDSAYDEAEKLGISFDTLTNYVLGNADAIDEVNTKGDEYIAGQNLWEALIQSRTGAVANLTYSLDTMAGSLTEAQKVELQKIQADEDAGVASEEMAAAIDVATEAAAAQIPTLEELIDVQMKAAGVVLSERDAQRNLQAAIDDATAALETNGQTLDVTTEAGRANQSALDDIASSGWDLIDSMRANGSSQEALQGTMQTSRDEFLNAAAAMGMGADEANRLADEMGLVPAKVTVDVAIDTTVAEQRLAAFKRLLAMPDIVISADLRNTGGYYADRAEGGVVYGPGTSTSDSIPARLSNGEYVVKASAVSQYGVGFFDNLNAQRFATGGYVGGGSRSAGSGQGGAPVTVTQYITTSDPEAAGIAGMRHAQMLRV